MTARSGDQRLAKVVPSALLGLLLSGCIAVGPDFVPPTVPAKADFVAGGRQGAVTERREPALEWWRKFNDPTLDRLVERAFDQNLTLRAAAIRIFEARAQLGIIIGDYFPQEQTVGAGYKRERVSKDIGLFREVSRVVDFDPTFDDWSAGFDASWEIDLWGKVRRGVEAASANLVASVAEYDDVLVTLTGDVATAYVTIRELQAEIALVRRAVATQEESLRITRLRFQTGVVTELDVDEATALLNNTKAEIPGLEADLAKAKNALAVLLGLPAGEVDALIAAHGKIPVPPKEIGIGVPAELLRRRPDVRAAELRALEQAAKIGVAKADLYPQFGVTGAIGVKATDLGELFQGRSITGLINPGIQWDVLNYGRIRNNVRVQDARYQELIAEYRQKVLEAYAEVEDALTAFFKAKEQALYLSRSVAASRRAQRISLSQYEDGTVDYNRVLDNQEALLRAEERLAAVRADVVTNLIAVYKGLGGGWQAVNLGDFLPAATRQEMAERTNWGRVLDERAIPLGARELALPPPPRAKPPVEPPDW